MLYSVDPLSTSVKTYWWYNPVSFQNINHIVLGLSWLKVYNQQHAGGYFPPPPAKNSPGTGEAFNEIFSYNEDDPDALRFSILGQIEKYRKNGALHIRLCYPEYTEYFPCNEWTQTSNFMQDEVITDYNPIRITYTQSDSQNDFDGLNIPIH